MANELKFWADVRRLFKILHKHKCNSLIATELFYLEWQGKK